MFKKMCMNVVFLCCVVLLSVFSVVNYPPLAGAQGVELQGLALDPDRGVDSYTKLMLHMENNVTDSAAGKTVTNNNATFSNSVYKMGGYSGVFNGSNASAGSGLRPEPMSLLG